MMYYKLVKVIMYTSRQAKIIINMVVQHHDLLDSIISDCRAIFMSKFWFLLCYFLGIKKQLSTMFYLQTDKQTEWQNSTIETYLCTFIN